MVYLLSVGIILLFVDINHFPLLLPVKTCSISHILLFSLQLLTFPFSSLILIVNFHTLRLAISFPLLPNIRWSFLDSSLPSFSHSSSSYYSYYHSSSLLFLYLFSIHFKRYPLPFFISISHCNIVAFGIGTIDRNEVEERKEEEKGREGMEWSHGVFHRTAIQSARPFELIRESFAQKLPLSPLPNQKRGKGKREREGRGREEERERGEEIEGIENGEE